MRMKFKSTTLNKRISVYKRFIGLEKSLNLETIYHTYDGLYWTFNSVDMAFERIALEDISTHSSFVNILNNTTYLQFQDTYFKYDDSTWVSFTTLDSENITLLSLTFNNIGKYQMNKYYYVGSISYMQSGSIDEDDTQFLKGNITPLVSLNIKYFNDDVKLTKGDLVVRNNKLYSIEKITIDNKHQPKDYNIYFATLNSIL